MFFPHVLDWASMQCLQANLPDASIHCLARRQVCQVQASTDLPPAGMQASLPQASKHRLAHWLGRQALPCSQVQAIKHTALPIGSSRQASLSGASKHTALLTGRQAGKFARCKQAYCLAHGQAGRQVWQVQASTALPTGS